LIIVAAKLMMVNRDVFLSHVLESILAEGLPEIQQKWFYIQAHWRYGKDFRCEIAECRLKIFAED
jgi:hypothetical protein